MSQNKLMKEENLVSNFHKKVLNLEVIEEEREKENKEEEKEETNSESLYEDFCNKYMLADFEKLTLEKLENIYGDGDILLDLYYITKKEEPEKNLCNQTTIMHLQYIIGSIIHTIQNKRYEREMKISEQINNAGQEIENVKAEISSVNNNVNNIITTVISMVLSISVINSAIIGIENIDPNYIMPFVSSIMFFGMVMIYFIYSIYKKNMSYKSIAMLITCLVITIILWIVSIYKWIDISKNKTETIPKVQNEILQQNNNML